MTYIPVATANVSAANSTTVTLGSGGTFTGTPEDVSQYASISIALNVNPTSSTGNVLVQFSNTISFPVIFSNTVTAVNSVIAAGFTLDVITAAQYFRVLYINDSASATATIQTILHPQARIAQATTRYAQTPTDYSDMLNTRAIIWGKTLGGGIYEPVATNGENSLIVNAAEPSTAFGSLDVSQDTPTCQIDFIYGVNTLLTSNLTASGGTIGWYDGMANVATAATVSSSASLLSQRYVRYRPGEGVKGRFTAMFTTGLAGNTQLAGLAAGTVDGMFWGTMERRSVSCTVIDPSIHGSPRPHGTSTQ